MSFQILGVGEVLWDLFPTGAQLGGAPGNFACHAQSLGANAKVITRVGRDERGDEILRRFEKMGLPVESVQLDDTAPTGTVEVNLSGNGVPQFIIHQNVAWDFLSVTDEALTLAWRADAICFGSLAQRSERSRQTIQQLVAAAPSAALKVFDINLRQNFYSREIIETSLHLANVFKLNQDELLILESMFGLEGSVQKQLETLAAKFDLQVIALTRGEQGSLLYQDGAWSDCPGRPVQVVDTVGAGDAFTAALVMGLLYKIDLDLINNLAGEVARYVCTCAGATPVLPETLRSRFRADSHQSPANL